MTHPVRPWYVCNANPCTCVKPAGTMPFTLAERDTLARFEAAPAAPESYQPTDVEA